MITIAEKDIKSVVRKAVREAIHAELVYLRAALTPLVSQEEMADIVRRYKKPSGIGVKRVRVSI